MFNCTSSVKYFQFLVFIGQPAYGGMGDGHQYLDEVDTLTFCFNLSLSNRLHYHNSSIVVMSTDHVTRPANSGVSSVTSCVIGQFCHGLEISLQVCVLVLQRNTVNQIYPQWNLGKCLKNKIKKVGFLTNSARPPPLPPSWLSEFDFLFYFLFFILMDSIHFKTYFSMKTKSSLPSFPYYSQSQNYLLSFEAFNDGMYSTNMVSFDCSPEIQQPR